MLVLTVDDTPAADQAAAEAADVEVVRCGQNLRRMTARVRVTNRSSLPSDYFIDVRFVRGPSRPGAGDRARRRRGPGADGSQKEAVVSTLATAGAFDCRIGDVDRLSA